MAAPAEQQLTDNSPTNEVIKLGEFSAAFARVYRVPRYIDGVPENDVEHSYSLGLVARYLADRFYPDLNLDLVVSFCMIHDAPERYANDTPTLGISEYDRARKEADEAVATQRLLLEFPESHADVLERYEKQEEPETKFVRLVDKLMPLIMNIVGDGRRSLGWYGIKTYDQLQAMENEARVRLNRQFPEFPEIISLHEELTQRRHEVIFNSEGELYISRLERVRGTLSDTLMRVARVVAPK
ncbi:HD domain-containing protein [Candidatus Nomurabacteria bacterium]|nr:HD domain-containing protein [Candidatus Saccharibacteria bacterium]MCA9313572.1 HD domain-containing protein [Candidatus Saccharibacteria bacterium]MCB9822422.1 HD domain-containing protein [Candidatus Nomurabacteria bacterium]